MFDEINYHDHLQLLEESKPYKDSVIWNFSDQYYKQKGILAWSEKADKPIPHRIGANYQNAFKLAEILKDHIGERSVKVLECGCGSGKFSRNFLFALRDLGISNQVKLVISDYSQKNLNDIKEKNILADFHEGSHYEFLLLDITKAEILADKSFEFIYLHYVLDALNLTVLKKISGEFKELNVKTLLRQNHEADIIRNPFLLARLEFEDNFKAPSKSQNKKILEFYSDYYANSVDTNEIYFLETVILSLEKLLTKLTDTGFLLSCDIDLGGDKRYVAVGNSLAHPIDSELLQKYFKKYNSFVLKEKSLSRLVFSKTDLKQLESTFIHLYKKNDFISKLLELEDQLEIKLDRSKLEELSLLAPYSAKTYFLWSRFFKENRDYNQAKLLEEKARSWDYWCDL
jgi:hypothetical protein